MKLEYLHDGAPECPLIRLYQFTSVEAVKLKEIFESLASGSLINFFLHEQAFIEPIGRCHLDLSLAKSNVGILQTASGAFTCDLTQEAWANLAFLTEPFCEKLEPNTYQWLNEDGPVSLLLSHCGTW